MPIITNRGHVSRALDFYKKTDIFFALGRHTTEWEDELIPDTPSVDMADLEELIGFKQVENKYLVIPDENGTLEYDERMWRIVPPNDAISTGARWVYLEAKLNPDELQLLPYRQIGIYTGVKRKPDVPIGQTALLPDEVEDTGILEVVDNIRKNTRQLRQRELFSVILEF